MLFTPPGLIQIFHFLHTLFHHGQSGFALLTNILTALGTLVRIYFLVMLCISPVDQRMFLLKIITKLVAWSVKLCEVLRGELSEKDSHRDATHECCLSFDMSQRFLRKLLVLSRV